MDSVSQGYKELQYTVGKKDHSERSFITGFIFHMYLFEVYRDVQVLELQSAQLFVVIMQPQEKDPEEEGRASSSSNPGALRNAKSSFHDHYFSVSVFLLFSSPFSSFRRLFKKRKRF